MTKILLTMKTFLTLSVLLIFGSAFLTAQNINWSGLMKDNAGNALANTNVALTFSILEGPGETLVYRETHNATTGSSGLVSAEIGGGTVSTGVFANLDFTKAYKLRTEADSGNGNVVLGVSEFKAVPLAKSANSAVTAKSTEKMQKGNSSIEIDNNAILIKENGTTSVSIQNGKLVIPALAGSGEELLQIANDGSIELKTVRYRTDYYNITGAGLNYPGFEYSAGDGFYNALGSASSSATIPLNLPHGASLERMTMEFKDTTAASGLIARLIAIPDNRMLVYGPLATVQSAKEFTHYSWLSLSTDVFSPSRKVVRNDLYSYYLHISGTDGWPASSLFLNKIIIEYKIPY